MPMRQAGNQEPFKTEALAQLYEAARDKSPVSGYTHNHYRYPARFSPQFVRAAIETFTIPGDVVLDPFMGGGTTLVEAMAMGRHGVGSDVSSLAHFLATVKTNIYTERDIQKLRRWIAVVAEEINIHRVSADDKAQNTSVCLHNLFGPSTWRIRKATEQAVASASQMRPKKLEQFARCVILRTAQWAIDGRSTIPTVADFRSRIVEFAELMISDAENFRLAAEKASGDCDLTRAICLHRSAEHLHRSRALKNIAPPRLILTSPPYPGIHVLYHRWQVHGRRETPAPFWIVGKKDGAGSKYYTLGGRKQSSLRSYYSNLRRAFESIRKVCGQSTTMIQMVAFSDPEWQLPKYLDIMTDAGFREVELPATELATDGRLWRDVPSRQWHANLKGKTSGSREVVLFHAPK